MLIKKKRIPLLHLIFIGLLPSALKKLIYRLKGYTIGRGVALNFGCIVVGENVKIKDYTSIGYFTIIRARKISIDRYVTIGAISYIDTENIEIGEDSRIREQVFIGGLTCPDSLLKLGKRCSIMQGSYLNPTKPIVFGNDSGVGGKCCVFTHGSWLSELEGFPVTFAPVTIGYNVFIPWNVFIMPGVTIGNNVVISASSHISTDLPDNCLAAGNPAKVVVKKFPFSVSNGVKESIKEKIFNDFIKHMEYNLFECTKVPLQSGFSIHVKRKNKSHQLIYLNKAISYMFDSKDQLLVLDSSLNIESINIQGRNKLTISLETKKRIGTSDIGEEFIKFISRYGIRFDRLD
jgi:acetyltransferase-like isoleucine patch superfamily enzyme